MQAGHLLSQTELIKAQNEIANTWRTDKLFLFSSVVTGWLAKNQKQITLGTSEGFEMMHSIRGNDFQKSGLVKSPKASLMRRRTVRWAAAVAAGLLAGSARATTVYWDTDGATPGAGTGGSANGTWDASSTSNWTTDSTGSMVGTTYATANGGSPSTADVVFSAGTNATSTNVTLSGAVVANSITVEELLNITSATTTPSLTLGAGGITINSSVGINTTTFISSLPTILSASQNWTNNAAGLFTVNGTITGAASLVGNLTVAGTGNTTLGGIIANGASSGNIGLIKSGTGKLILGAVNTYTGGTTVNDGTLQLNVTTGATATGVFTLGGGTLAINQAGNNFGYAATINLTANSTFSNLGAGAINYTGAINGNNNALTVNNTGNRMYINGTVTGVTQFNVTAGAMGFDLSGGNSGGNAPVFVSNGASLWAVNSTIISGNNITLNGGTGYNGTGAIFQENQALTTTLAGTITLNATSSIGVANAGGTISLTGNVTGAGGITKIGAGTLRLSGSANDYGGNTTISAGTLQLGNGGTTGSLLSTGNISIALTATLAVNRSNAVAQGTDFGTIVGTTGILTQLGTGALTLAGSNSITTLNVNNATGTVDIGSGNLTINNGGGNTIQSTTGGTINATGGGAIVLGSTLGDTGTASGTTLTINAKITSGAAVQLEYWNGAAGNTGTLVLTNASNDFTGGVIINTSGTISVSTINNTGFAGNLGTGGTITLAQNGSTLKYTGAGETTNRTVTMGGGANLGGTINASGNGTALKLSSVTNTSTANGTNTLILTGTGLGEITGTLANQNGSRLTAITKAGNGTWTLSGNNSYTGATAVNGGTLVLGNNGNLSASAVTVSNAGSTFAIKQTASATSNALTGSLSLGAGTAFTMVDGFTSTFNVTGASTLAPASGTSPTLSFELGAASGTSDTLAIVGAATVGAGGALLNISLAATPSSAANTYTVITAASGLNTNFSLTGFTNYSIGGTVYHLSLATSTSASEIVSFVAGGVSAPNAFWTGSQDSSWATQPGSNNTNFATDATGATNTLILPDSNTNVTFTANSATNLTTTLDQAFTINSLTFSGNGTSNTAGSSIAGGAGVNPLTINAAAVNGNTAGNGITMAAGSGNSTISADVILGGNQTWTNNSANSLAVSGNISGTNLGVTKAGTGTIVLSGNNTYTGATTVSAGTLELQAASAISSSSAVTINTGGTLSLRSDANTTFTPASLTGSNGNFTIAVDQLTGAGAGKTLTLANTFNTGGSGSNLTVSSTSGDTLLLSSQLAQFNASSPNATINLSGANMTLNTGVNFNGATNGPLLIVNANSNTLVINGTWTTGTNRWSGIQVNNGTVTLAYGQAGGSSTNNGVYAVLNGGTLNFNNANAIGGANAGNNFTINGGTLDNTSGSAKTMSRNPAVTINGDFAFSTSGGTSANDLSLGTNTVSLGSAAGTTRTITTNGSATLTVGGVIGNGTTANSINKAGTGTMALSGNNTYTGTTTIAGGSLVLSGSFTNNIASSSKIIVGDSLAHNTANLSVAGLTGGTIVLGTNQILAGYGTVNGNVTGVSTSVVAPGNSTGQLTVNGNFDLGGGKLGIQIDKSSGGVITTNASAGSQYDQLIVSGATSTVSVAGGTLVLELGNNLANGDVYYIVDNQGSGATGAFTSAIINGVTFNSGSLATSGSTFGITGSYMFTINYADNVSGTSNDISLFAQSVPEPTSLSILVMGTAGLLSRRSRRRKVC
ncbi:hypothetical protein BH10PLA1_BH10PLA1_01190 [soil metagenome]